MSDETTIVTGSDDDVPPTKVLHDPRMDGASAPTAVSQGVAAAETTGARLGDCTLIEQTGEGGFGIVWKASQDKPLQRIVAVKIIKPGMDSKEVVARFARERQALAVMEHPGIATIFDAGMTDSGRPYFVMEFVDGVPLTSFCDQHRLDAKARLELMLQVCSAVQHAHQKGIIHRDLKPSNILVSGTAKDPRPSVIDFGVARALDYTGVDAIQTREYQFIGTPAYMSPEQASLGSVDVDTRSDIYSLGVLLYQLLTGTTPFAAKTTGATLDEVRRIVRNENPPAPSTAICRLKGDALTTVMSARNTALNTLNRLLRRDLDWIVIRALEKDRERRYQTVAALSADIRRYLVGEPVVARTPDLGYRAGKFLRKHRRPAMAAGAILLVLTGGLAASTTMMLREKDAVRRESAQREKLDSETAKVLTESNTNEQTAIFLNDLLSGISPDIAQGADRQLMKRILTKAAEKIGAGFTGQPKAEAFLRNTIGGTYFAMGLSADAKRQFEAGYSVAGRELGPENRMTLRLRGNLASVTADVRKAESENREILAIRMKVFPANDRETLATMVNLADVLAEQGKMGLPGKMQAAAEQYAAVNKLQKETLGETDRDTLRSRLALANTKRDLKEDVVDEYRSVVALMEKNSELGPDHPDTLAARYGLADALLFAGEPGEAYKEHTVVFERRVNILGPTHKKTLRSRFMMGNVRLRQKDPYDARKIFREVLPLQETEAKQGRVKVGEVFATRIGLAGSVAALGEAPEAERQLRSVIADMETAGLNPADALLLSARDNLAHVLQDQKKYPAAEDEYRKVLDIRRGSLPKEHPMIGASEQNLAEVLRQQGKPPEPR